MSNANDAIATLMDLLQIEGVSGQEQAVADYVVKFLLANGCRRSWISFDHANKKLGSGFEIGNLIVKLPGTVRGPRLLFSAHLDTVPLCRGAVPVRRGDRIVPKGKTALRGDDRAGVAILLNLARCLLKNKAAHPPLTLLFTIAEEIGLRGSSQVAAKSLGNPKLGFNFDGGRLGEIGVGAVGADRWEVEIYGRASHAGKAPEKGVSSALIFAKAVAAIEKAGMWGKVKKGKNTGTSNIGIVKGGEATNQVMDYLYVKGESRSHNPRFLEQITGAIRRSFEEAAKREKSVGGSTGKAVFKAKREYNAFSIGSKDAVVQHAERVMKGLGYQAKLVQSNAGLDANYLNEKGIPTVTFGTGAHNAHTVEEYVSIEEYLAMCGIAVALVV